MKYDEFAENPTAVKLSQAIAPELLPEVLAMMRSDAAAMDGTVGNIRGRAAGLLSTAALVVALGTTLGAIHIGAAGNGVQLDWVATTLLLLVAFTIGILAALIQRPRPWVFSPGTDVFMHREPIAARQGAVAILEQGRAKNAAHIAQMLRLFNASTILLGIEVVIILSDVLIHLIWKF
ncbi:hypothetical protein [uncultured Amnibacterium sp.]|uniref:hypothetical protein n=1 Tax=uncultured Amnibacterium sp. TaxID=1631851 RepID=UPI0035C9EF7B